MRGSLMPRSEKARWTKPEQSSPLAGSVPPNTYGTPRYFLALATTASPLVDPVPSCTAASSLANAVPSVAVVAVVWAARIPSWVWMSEIRPATSAKLTRGPRGRRSAARRWWPARPGRSGRPSGRGGGSRRRAARRASRRYGGAGRPRSAPRCARPPWPRPGRRAAGRGPGWRPSPGGRSARRPGPGRCPRRWAGGRRARGRVPARPPRPARHPGGHAAPHRERRPPEPGAHAARWRVGTHASLVDVPFVEQAAQGRPCLIGRRLVVHVLAQEFVDPRPLG